jgi:enoyl-CoA hydratase/carnithine racemase
MAHETLLVDRSRPGLAVVTLNRPAKLDALSHHMLLALDEAINELQATAHAMAEHLLSMPASELRAHKRLIDDGYALSLQEGLALEAERSAEHNAKVTPAAIAARRRELPLRK